MNEELIALRDEMRLGFAQLQSGITQVQEDVTGLRTDVTELRGDVTELRGDVTQLQRDVGQLQRNDTLLQASVTQLQVDMATLHQGLAMLGRRVDRLEDAVRGNGVLLEALRDEVRQIAEAYVLLDQRVERYRVENETAHREIAALLLTSYRELDRRVTQLEQQAGDSGVRPS